jgi:ligand-binding sensor domain-containing protein
MKFTEGQQAYLERVIKMNGLDIIIVKTHIKGSVFGHVWGDVEGDVWGSVKGDVWGTVNDREVI